MTNETVRPVRVSAVMDPTSENFAGTAMLLSDENVPGISQCLGVATVAPGEPATSGLAHETAEVMLVAEGEGELLTSQGPMTFSKGDAIYIPANLKHALRNTGDTILVSVFSFPASNRPADSVQPY